MNNNWTNRYKLIIEIDICRVETNISIVDKENKIETNVFESIVGAKKSYFEDMLLEGDISAMVSYMDDLSTNNFRAYIN